MKNYILTTLLIVLLGSCHYNIPEGDVMNGNANPDPDPKTFPDQLFLPDGFGPEGITSGRAYDFFVGSVASGAIYKGSFRTGEGAILVPSPEGKRALGLAYDGRTDYLYVAGGNGEARVYDATKFGKSIYAVNARFDEVDPFGRDVPDILFDVIRVDK